MIQEKHARTLKRPIFGKTAVPMKMANTGPSPSDGTSAGRSWSVSAFEEDTAEGRDISNLDDIYTLSFKTFQTAEA